MWLRCIFVVSAFCCFSAQAQTYTAYSFQHAAATTATLTPDQRVLQNINYFEGQFTTRDSIYVLPEYGLTGIDDIQPEKYAIFLNGTFPYENIVLKHFSDAAKEHNAIIVVNLIEKDEVDKTVFYYNTNVVFSGTDGKILTKYRKINLADWEKKLKLTAGKDVVTFDALGTTFGVMTGRDLFYDNPGQQLVKKAKEIVLPYAQQSILPFFVSTSVQKAYAVANRVNLIASALNDPTNSYGGAGVYQYDGLTKQGISPKAISEPFSLTLQRSDGSAPDTCDQQSPRKSPRGLNPPDISDYVTLKQFEPRYAKFRDLDMKQAAVEEKDLCSGNVCCDLTANVQSATDSNVYRLVAFDGKMDTISMNFCSLLICGKDTKSCGDRIATSTVFNNITLVTRMKHRSPVILPSTLNSQLLAVEEAQFCEKKDGLTSVLTLQTSAPVSNLVTFGVVGIDKNSAIGFGPSTFLLILAGTLFAIFRN